MTMGYFLFGPNPNWFWVWEKPRFKTLFFLPATVLKLKGADQ
jgi:hypothetical protein